MPPAAFRQLQGRLTFAAAALLVISSQSCLAADASPWDKGTHSAARLLAGGAIREQSGTVLRAGIEITLQPGWKTYWRYPGDSGVPPRFSFARSENAADVTVLWPAPHRFFDGSGNSIGYTQRVIFPVHVTALDERKPVLLRVDFDYGVCEKLCVPVDSKLELSLTRDATAHDAAIAASEARVPQRAALGLGDPLAVLGVKREAGPRFPRVTVDLAARAQSGVDLFAEGPTAHWALPLPQPVAGAPPGVRRFAFDLDGLPPDAKLEGALLKLTAVSDAAAIEVLAHLD
jgi:DsbC/DsbD-like thiol-disulfide interchange protein